MAFSQLACLRWYTGAVQSNIQKYYIKLTWKKQLVWNVVHSVQKHQLSMPGSHRRKSFLLPYKLSIKLSLVKFKLFGFKIRSNWLSNRSNSLPWLNKKLYIWVNRASHQICNVKLHHTNLGGKKRKNVVVNALSIK